MVPVSWPPCPGSITILPIFSPSARISDRSPLAVGLASRISKSSSFLDPLEASRDEEDRDEDGDKVFARARVGGGGVSSSSSASTTTLVTAGVVLELESELEAVRVDEGDECNLEPPAAPLAK